MPLPRNSIQLDYSRWQHSLIGVLQIDVAYHSKIKIGKYLSKLNKSLRVENQKNVYLYFFEIAPKTKLIIDARLGYRNKGDPDDAWKPYAASVVERNLECSINTVNITRIFYF